MNAVQTEQPQQPSGETKLSFFRQSGWMLFATTLGGGFFWAVHFAARGMPESEYGIVGTLLQVLNQMSIPAMGLQWIFVQEAALTETEEHRRELAGAVRSVAKATFIAWIVAAVAVWIFRHQILINYKLFNPVALWATVGMGLVSLWLPIVTGILLGRQNFLWAGINNILVAFCRLVLVTLIVFVVLSPIFTSSDLLNVPAVAARLKQNIPASTYLMERLSAKTRQALATYQGSASETAGLGQALKADFRSIIDATNNVYAEADLKGVEFRPETLALAKKQPEGVELVRLNRWVLEDIFPKEIARRPLPLGWYSSGTMIGVLLAMIIALVVGGAATFRLWTGKATKFRWTPWLKRVIPLTIGTGATTFMFTVDMLAVQRFLHASGSGHYAAAGMIARAIMFLVAPIVMVMFPKIVRSAARSEQSDVLGQTLGLTTLIAIGAALFATFFAKIPILIVQGPTFLPAVPLVPWFTWCILPLTVSSVLVNNLMARQEYRVVPWLALVAVAYVTALWLPIGHASQLTVIKTLGVFALLYFLVCLWFTWGMKMFGRERS